jgi:hypothetical protein
MGCSRKFSIIMMMVIFLLSGMMSSGLAATLHEKNLTFANAIKDGKATSIATIKEANGGPEIKAWKVKQPKVTIPVTVSLSVKQGSYKIEFFDDDNVSLVLTSTSKNGEKVSDSGPVTVNDNGEIKYRVTAKKASGVTITLSFVPVVSSDEKNKAFFENPQAAIKASISQSDLTLTLSCMAGKYCRLQVQNTNPSVAYSNISFNIEYNEMASPEPDKKSRSGRIEEPLLPGSSGEWQMGMAFGAPPKDIKIKFITADAVDPATIKRSDSGQKKNDLIRLAKKDQEKKSPAPALASPSKYLPTTNDFQLLRFFESDPNALPLADRKYKSEFIAEETRFINWELNLTHPAPGKKVNYDIEAAWMRSDGTIITRQIQHALMQPDWEYPYSSYLWGSKEPGGFWQPGDYKVELSVGGKVIAGGGFKVK